DDFGSLMEELRLASDVFDQAVYLREAGFCVEASVLLSEALHEYGEVASEAFEHDDEDDHIYENTIEAIELREKLDRADDIYSTLRATSDLLAEKGLDVTLLEDILNETAVRFLEVRNATEGNHFERADELLSEVEDLLDDAYDTIEIVNRPKTSERVSIFLNKTKARMGKLEDRIMELLRQTNASQDMILQAEMAFHEVNAELVDIELSIDILDLDDIFEDLDDIFDEIDDAYDILDEEIGDAGEILEEMDETEAWFDYLKSRITELDRAGYNVSELTSMLENAENMSTSIRHGWEQRNYEQLDDEVDELEDLLDELEDMIPDWTEGLDDDNDDNDDNKAEAGDSGIDEPEYTENDDGEIDDEGSEESGDIKSKMDGLDSLVHLTLERIKVLEANGTDVTEIEGLLNMTWELLDEVRTELDQDNNETAKQILDEAEDLYSEADEMTRDLLGEPDEDDSIVEDVVGEDDDVDELDDDDDIDDDDTL
ncbi:MAG TPA: hypothetical protein VM050_08430, partial [Patescibacteria group bacterium]|nr:hypothetical protein [Patescibacteria group bacterium]